MIKTVTTTAGVNTIAFPEFFKYFWIKNIGDTTVYASAYTNVAAGVDNTSVINSGEAVCIENVDNDNVYISGAGSVEIHAQDFPDCSFKLGTKGGGSGGSGQQLLLLKYESLAYTATSSYTFLVDDKFNASDYKMFICIIKDIGSVAFTPELGAVKIRGDGDNMYTIQWVRDNMFDITNMSGAALSYFGYQLFGIKG